MCRQKTHKAPLRLSKTGFSWKHVNKKEKQRKDKENEKKEKTGGKLSEDGAAREGESNVGIRSVPQYLHSPHCRLRVLPLRVQHLIVLSPTLLRILPSLNCLSGLSVPGFWHLCVYICMYVWTSLSLQSKHVRNM